MQLRILALSVVLFATLVAASVTAESEASRWLQERGNAPNSDELGELKAVNPSAYALVKALLTKRSLGLLNPKHPTASFAAPSAEQSEAVEQGPEAFAKFASPAEHVGRQTRTISAAEVSLPYAEVTPAAHHDWLSWKPQKSAMDDEQMVQNVLGAVAELKGGKGKNAGFLTKHRQVDESPLAEDEASFGVNADRAPAVAKPSAPQAPKAAKSPYMDFSMLTAPEKSEEHKETPAKENSYLKGLDLTADSPKALPSTHKKQVAAAQKSANNYLTSFSWDDEAKPQPSVRQTEHKHQELKAGAKSSNLLAWLGVVKKVPTPAKQAPAAKPSNPYMMDLGA